MKKHFAFEYELSFSANGHCTASQYSWGGGCYGTQIYIGRGVLLEV